MIEPPEPTPATDATAAAPLSGRRVAVITVSDRAARGEYPDRSGPLLVEALTALGASVSAAVVPDDEQAIQAAVTDARDGGARLIITTGGTGLGPRDVTPEAVAPLLDRHIPGIAEALRAAGAAATPMAALSRGVAGTIGTALVITLPGSPGAVRDAVAVLTPLAPHALAQLDGGDH